MGFLASEQNAQEFDSPVLLSGHSILARDHRKLFLRHQLQGGAVEKVSSSPAMNGSSCAPVWQHGERYQVVASFRRRPWHSS